VNGPPLHGPLSALRPFDALLALEDGTVFFGHSCGAHGEAAGEVVFNTSMTGYPEIITDPSYRGQIVTFTYPLIGNYGINSLDAESPKPQLSGVVVRSMCGAPSNWRSREALPDYLRRHRVVAIEGVDTRALTRRLRSAGVMRAMISTKDLNPESLVAKARASLGLAGRDLVNEVTLLEATPWLKATCEPAAEPAVGIEGTGAFELPTAEVEYDEPAFDGDPAILAVEAAIEARRAGKEIVLPRSQVQMRVPRPRPPVNTSTAVRAATPTKIAILHCGMKANIAEELRRRGAVVKVYPSSTPIARILADKPDGLVLSNGPGDPEGVEGVVEGVREALGQVPMFGICLGIQMLALAFGGRTYKLKFGHRGGNQPVLDLTTGRVEITAQNHGYAVDPKSLEAEGPDDVRSGLTVTHLNLNDGTIEGFAHPDLDVVAVQYHPEAAPGPHDAAYLFDRFLATVRARQAARARETGQPEPAGRG
jgi:carbamoyl-phosphate synthase small subunit